MNPEADDKENDVDEVDDTPFIDPNDDLPDPNDEEEEDELEDDEGSEEDEDYLEE